MKKFKILYFLIIIYLASVSKALAYLDPGTGSVILQAIIAAIATAGATIAFYWRKIKMLIKNFFEKKDKNNSPDK